MSRKKGLLIQMVEWDTELAIKMWNEGKTSGMIALHFKVTRNMVIGKLTRARNKGIYVKHKTKEAQVKSKLKVEIAKKLSRHKPLPKPEVLLPLKATVVVVKPVARLTAPTIYELNSNECKFPTGENEFHEYVFCGKETTGVYCDKHYEICYRKPESKPAVQYVNHKNKFMHTR